MLIQNMQRYITNKVYSVDPNMFKRLLNLEIYSNFNEHMKLNHLNFLQ